MSGIEPIFMEHPNGLESVETIGKRLEFGKATMEPKSLGQGNGEWNNVSKDGRWNTGHTHCVYKL